MSPEPLDPELLRIILSGPYRGYVVKIAPAKDNSLVGITFFSFRDGWKGDNIIRGACDAVDVFDFFFTASSGADENSGSAWFLKKYGLLGGYIARLVSPEATNCEAKYALEILSPSTLTWILFLTGDSDTELMEVAERLFAEPKNGGLVEM